MGRTDAGEDMIGSGRQLMNHEDLRIALDRLGGYQFLNSGYDDKHNISWVKMRYQRNETGYRSLEFLAWLTTDMIRARDPISFYPTAAPPYLNEPGKVLSFVIQIYHDSLSEGQFDKMVTFIHESNDKYYDQCRA